MKFATISRAHRSTDYSARWPGSRAIGSSSSISEGTGSPTGASSPWSRVFTRNRLVRHDGPLSVLRGFARDDLLGSTRKIAGFDWTVRSYTGFQLALVGRRPQSLVDPRIEASPSTAGQGRPDAIEPAVSTRHRAWPNR